MDPKKHENVVSISSIHEKNHDKMPVWHCVPETFLNKRFWIANPPGTRIIPRNMLSNGLLNNRKFGPQKPISNTPVKQILRVFRKNKQLKNENGFSQKFVAGGFGFSRSKFQATISGSCSLKLKKTWSSIITQFRNCILNTIQPN